MQSTRKYISKNYIKLSVNEVKELFNNKEANEDKIIKSQLPLVYNLASKYSITTPLDINELFSIGLEALTEAMNRYDASRETSFTTYAKLVIKSKFNVQRFKCRLIPVPTSLDKNKAPIAYTYSTFANAEIESRITSTISTECDLNYKYLSNEDILVELIETTLNHPQQSYIIIQHLGINQDKKRTQTELAKELNTSKQYVGQQFKKGIQKLKQNQSFTLKLTEFYL